MSHLCFFSSLIKYQNVYKLKQINIFGFYVMSKKYTKNRPVKTEYKLLIVSNIKSLVC